MDNLSVSDDRIVTQTADGIFQVDTTHLALAVYDFESKDEFI